MNEYRKGERLEMTDKGYRQGLEGTCGKPCYSKLVRTAGDGALVVVREGLVTEERWHPDFWRLASTTESGR